MAQELETDVVVVAAGLSGLAASIAAAEGGARVILLEKAANTGGAANMGMGPCATGSPVQRASMIEVTPGELFRRHMFYHTHYQVDPRLVRARTTSRAATPSSGCRTWASCSTPCARRSVPAGAPAPMPTAVHLARGAARGRLRAGSPRGHHDDKR